MIRPIAASGTVAAVLFVFACSTGPEVEPDPEEVEPSEEPEILEVHTEDLVVAPQWLEERLQEPELVVLHVGDDYDEWASAHIPGQDFVAFEEIVEGDPDRGFSIGDVDELRQAFESAGVGDDDQVVLTGGLEGLMATRGFLSLEVLGRTDGVALLDGGLEQWREEQRPLSDSPVEPTPGSLSVEASTEMILEADDVLARIDDAAYQLVDARPSEEFRGEVAGDGVERAGHIPGAVNLFWKEMLKVDDRPLFLSVDEIAEKYRAAGVDEQATIIAYCRTGMQSSFGYFVGRLMGRDTLIYDGSMVDWTQDEERPVVNGED